MRLWKQAAGIFGMLTGVLIFGAFGYRYVELWSWFDSFYMSLITLTTVGYGEVHPLSDEGRIFTSILIVIGVTAVFVSIGILADLVLQLELGDHFGRRRKRKMLEKLSGHYIVCGAGRVGRGVIGELRRSGAQVLLIDSDPKRSNWAEENGILTLIADATMDETLKQGRIDKAIGLVAAIGSDAENVYVALSARVLNPQIRIVARASDEQAEEKLRRAGASTVFTPYSFIGHRLAQALLRPHVLSFLDIASAFHGSDLDLEIEQVKVSARSVVAGKTLEESRLRQSMGVIVLSVMPEQGDMKFNPGGETRIEAGDVLIAMGERSKLREMERVLEA